MHAGDVKDEVLVSHERPEERFAFAVVARVLARQLSHMTSVDGKVQSMRSCTIPMVEPLHSKSHPSGQRTKPASSTISAPGVIAGASLE